MGTANGIHEATGRGTERKNVLDSDCWMMWFQLQCLSYKSLIKKYGIEAYLVIFQRVMAASEMAKDHWPNIQVPLLIK